MTDTTAAPLTDQELTEFEAVVHNAIPLGADIDPVTVQVLVAEVRRLRAELAPYEMLAPQQCAAGKHADWLVDSEYAHACPWCRIADLERPTAEEAPGAAR